MDRSLKDIKIFAEGLQSLQGPQKNWIIDALGNILLRGRLQVKGWIDPTFLQLDNQTSSSGIPNNSIYTLNNELTFKNSSGTVKTVAADQEGVRCRVNSQDTNTVLSSTLTSIITETISPVSSSNKILVMAGYTGTASNADFGTPRVTLRRSTTIFAEYSQDDQGAAPANRTFGGAIIGLDAPSTTNSTSYNLAMSESLSGTWTLIGSSICLIEVEDA
jgi:hypothetical protein